MSTGVLDTLSFPYPPIELQEEYVCLLRSVRRMSNNISRGGCDADNVFNALVQNAFKGEL